MWILDAGVGRCLVNGCELLRPWRLRFVCCYVGKRVVQAEFTDLVKKWLGGNWMGNRPLDWTCDWLNWEGDSDLMPRGGMRLGELMKRGIELPDWMAMRHRT